MIIVIDSHSFFHHQYLPTCQLSLGLHSCLSVLSGCTPPPAPPPPSPLHTQHPVALACTYPVPTSNALSSSSSEVNRGVGEEWGGGKEEQADCCHCPHWQEGGLWLLFNLAVLGGEGWNPSQHISHLKS